MKLVAVLYATSEGHTRRIAEHIVGTLIALGYTSELIDVDHVPKTFELRRCIAAILAASVHFGRHQPEMIAYVKANRARLIAWVANVCRNWCGCHSGISNSSGCRLALACLIAYLERFHFSCGGIRISESSFGTRVL